MADSPKEEEKGRWWQRFSLKKLNRKYVFMMSHDETMEPIVDFKVNLNHLFILTIGIIIVLIAVTCVIIAFTPLREYIPGYTNTSLEREVLALNRRADSIEDELKRKDIYFNNLKLVIEGYDFAEDSLGLFDIYTAPAGLDIDTIEIKKSVQDSALRAEFEAANLYELSMTSNLVKERHYNGVTNFFTPITGTVILPYDPNNGHFGVDIASNENQVIKATLDGTVIYASWMLNGGYTIGIQHDNNYFSTYKHNATLLKQEGDFVKAGEAIAILGKSGVLTEAPHLHFELWRNGVSLNPEEYVNFTNNITQ